MKNYFGTKRMLFLMSIIGYLIASSSVFFLPLAMPGDDERLSLFSIVIGVMFWGGIFAGILFFVLCWKKVKRDNGYLQIRKDSRPGYLSFFANRYSFIADIVLIAALIVIILERFLTWIPDIIVIFSMFFLIITACLHFMMNGRVYRYLFLKR